MRSTSSGSKSSERRYRATCESISVLDWMSRARMAASVFLDWICKPICSDYEAFCSSAARQAPPGRDAGGHDSHAPWFEAEFIPIVERAHVKLADSREAMRPV